MRPQFSGSAEFDERTYYRPWRGQETAREDSRRRCPLPDDQQQNGHGPGQCLLPESSLLTLSLHGDAGLMLVMAPHSAFGVRLRSWYCSFERRIADINALGNQFKFVEGVSDLLLLSEHRIADWRDAISAARKCQL